MGNNLNYPYTYSWKYVTYFVMGNLLGLTLFFHFYFFNVFIYHFVIKVDHKFEKSRKHISACSVMFNIKKLRFSKE